ncbi:hypothetical protein [Arthrobacter sp. B0490]|uniref:hypothetical protein n=1 Tax=Arthrobacter sp. B0490 TaxID=2058891 RepID=UPI000CE41585|nr:hypothetical protein [Arthrobacter sp. B0490]
MAAALQKAGIDVQLQTVPGGHTWEAWKAGLQDDLDWLMKRYGVLPQESRNRTRSGHRTRRADEGIASSAGTGRRVALASAPCLP